MRALLLVVLGLVLAGSLWLLVGGWAEPTEAMPVSPAAAPTEPATPVAEPPAAEEPGESGRTEVVSPPSVEVGEGQVAYRVRVVSARTDEPVARAVDTLKVTGSSQSYASQLSPTGG